MILSCLKASGKHGAEVGPGSMRGYREVYAIRRGGAVVALVAGMGGNTKDGRYTTHVSLTGGFLHLLTPPVYDRLVQVIAKSRARIARLDLAVDFLHGEHTVQDAWDAYHADSCAFSLGRRPPKITEWNLLCPENGASVYIGKRGNGKMLRVYDKGAQQGDEWGKWYRWELELRGKDRTIPCAALLRENWVKFFAGGYPILEEITKAQPIRIQTGKEQAILCPFARVGRAIANIRKQWGRYLGVLFDTFDQATLKVLLTKSGARWTEFRDCLDWWNPEELAYELRSGNGVREFIAQELLAIATVA